MATTTDRPRPLHELESIESRPWCRFTGITPSLRPLSRPITSCGALHRQRSTPASALRRRDGSRHHAVLPVARDSISIADRQCSGFVQSVFRSPPRRAHRPSQFQRFSAAPPTEERSGLALDVHITQSVFCVATRRQEAGSTSEMLGRRGGAQKTGWTKPLPRRCAMGIE